jgi:glutamine cyclotransferase
VCVEKSTLLKIQQAAGFVKGKVFANLWLVDQPLNLQGSNAPIVSFVRSRSAAGVRAATRSPDRS